MIKVKNRQTIIYALIFAVLFVLCLMFLIQGMTGHGEAKLEWSGLVHGLTIIADVILAT